MIYITSLSTFLTDAFKAKERKERVVAKVEADQKKELKEMQWEMNKGSKKLMRSYSKNGDVSDRLYQNGLQEKEKRLEYARKETNDYKKVAKTHQLEEKLRVNSWSCASCGTFHELTSVQIKSSVNSIDVKKICSSCSWDQSKRTPFKVINNAGIFITNFRIPFFLLFANFTI